MREGWRLPLYGTSEQAVESGVFDKRVMKITSESRETGVGRPPEGDGTGL